MCSNCGWDQEYETEEEDMNPKDAIAKLYRIQEYLRNLDVMDWGCDVKWDSVYAVERCLFVLRTEENIRRYDATKVYSGE